MATKKKICKVLRREAVKLPEEKYNTFHNFDKPQTVTIEENGESKEVKVYGTRLIHPVNHYRRLKRLYKKHGIKAVHKYFQERGFEQR